MCTRNDHIYRVQNSRVPSAKWQAKMGNWHTIKYLDGQMNKKMVSQNIFGLPKQILMALQIFFLFHALSCKCVIIKMTLAKKVWCTLKLP